MPEYKSRSWYSLFVIILIGYIGLISSYLFSGRYLIPKSKFLLRSGTTPLVANGKRVEAVPGSSLMTVSN